MTYTGSLISATPRTDGVEINIEYSNGVDPVKKETAVLGDPSLVYSYIQQRADYFTQEETKFAQIQAAVANLQLGQVNPSTKLSTFELDRLKPYFDPNLTDQQNMDAFNAVNVPNPMPQGSIPVPMDATTIIGSLSLQSLANLYKNPNANAIRSDIDGQRVQAVMNWAGLALAAGEITQTEHDNVIAAASATTLDSSWPPYVSRSESTIGMKVNLLDMAAVRARL